MFKIGTYTLYLLIAWHLCEGQSESQEDVRSVCLLKDPPNQCGEFCLSVLEPLLNHIAKHQEQWNTSDALKLNDTQAKLDRIQTKLEGQTVSLEDSLKKVLPQDFQERLTRMEAHQTDIQKAMGSQLEVQINLEKEQKSLMETFKNTIPENFNETLGKLKEQHISLQETLKKIPVDLEEKLNRVEDHQKAVGTQLETQINLAKDQKSQLEALNKSIPKNFEERLIKMEEQQTSLHEAIKKIPEDFESRLQTMEKNQKDIQSKMETQQVKIMDTLTEIYGKVFWPKFERIGSRLLYIDRQNAYPWITAVSTCREMNGYLAAIKDQEELDIIKAKLGDKHYWLGINDRASKGAYKSEASGREAVFIKWKSGEPNHAGPEERCVELANGEMNDDPCSAKKYIICQTNSDF
ncbi:C-type lectin domain family 4 member M-like [Drosophila takahashii]|uniref:C-type lectin domain family 4 member M-like n=1 Tax=Drosophila takahashii TaxID=29030 RepID=UPI001CF92559|nr:CD209 antigen-like protein B [Drosophila takahashii]